LIDSNSEFPVADVGLQQLVISDGEILFNFI
jgi:hypothetical protein